MSLVLPDSNRRRRDVPPARPGFRAAIDGGAASTVRTPLAERRRQALERLEVSTVPRRRLAHRGARAEGVKPAGRSTPMRNTLVGPAPLGYYMIAIVVAVFVMLGLVMVLSASAPSRVGRGSVYEDFYKQLTWAVLGSIGLFIATRVHLGFVRRLARTGLVIGLALMVLPFVPGLGSSVRGARAWITLGPLSMQPSEFLKLAVAVFAADLLVRRQHELTDFRRCIRPLLLLLGAAAGASVVQGDLGSAIVLASIVLAVAFIGGVPFTPMAITASAGAALAGIFVLSSPYRRDRFLSFMDMDKYKGDEAYQVYQSMLAIASGGFTGSGVGNGNGKLGYLPLAHSDFIFAVVVEELGLVGAVAVIGGFAVLTWFGIQAALSSPDRFGMLVAGGISAWFGVQAIVNMGGVVGIMPVTGLTLPFFSAGGSSLFISMTAAGLLLNVARRGNEPVTPVTPVTPVAR